MNNQSWKVACFVCIWTSNIQKGRPDFGMWTVSTHGFWLVLTQLPIHNRTILEKIKYQLGTSPSSVNGFNIKHGRILYLQDVLQFHVIIKQTLQLYVLCYHHQFPGFKSYPSWFPRISGDKPIVNQVVQLGKSCPTIQESYYYESRGPPNVNHQLDSLQERSAMPVSRAETAASKRQYSLWFNHHSKVLNHHSPSLDHDSTIISPSLNWLGPNHMGWDSPGDLLGRQGSNPWPKRSSWRRKNRRGDIEPGIMRFGRQDIMKMTVIFIIYIYKYMNVFKEREREREFQSYIYVSIYLHM